jgi:cytochrome c biogenesis protein CcmG/thiol:disulfide interchange protein DsbE
MATRQEGVQPTLITVPNRAWVPAAIAAGSGIVLVALLLLLSFGLQQKEIEGSKVVPVPFTQAPDFSLGLFDGSTFQLSTALQSGKPVVLNFWASWCVPCKGEAALLERASRQYRNVVFIGVDYHDVTSDARNFLRHHDVTYPIVQDGSGDIGDHYGITGVPETYFIDRRGRLVGKHIVGTIVNQQDAFRRGVEAALNS